jgi:hypothetical protein
MILADRGGRFPELVVTAGASARETDEDRRQVRMATGGSDEVGMSLSRRG